MPDYSRVRGPKTEKIPPMTCHRLLHGLNGSSGVIQFCNRLDDHESVSGGEFHELKS